MGLFEKRLSDAQNQELRRFVDDMNGIAAKHSAAYESLATSLRDLYLACLAARQERRRRLEGLQPASLDKARQVVAAYQGHLSDFHAHLASLQAKEWFPKNLTGKYANRLKFIETERKSLSTVMEALSPPDPLVDKPEVGAAKINMFISMLDIATMFAKELAKPVTR